MEQLPSELVEDILNLVDDQVSLYNVCLASKDLYRVTVRFLYRHFSHRMYEKPTRLHNFIRTILLKPELAGEVTTVELKDPERTQDYWDLHSWENWARANYNPVVSEDDTHRFLDASRLLQREDTYTVNDLLKREQAQAALLLSMLPNLTRLLIDNPATTTDTPRFHMNHLLFDILSPALKSGKTLQNLTALVATSARLEGGQGGFRVASIAGFFHLPRLTTVKLMICYEPQDEHWGGFDCPERTSAVKNLIFQNSAICPIALDLVIAGCKALEVFECDWSGRIIGWVELNFNRLRKALWAHRKSLRRLYLDTRKRFDDWPEADDGLIPPLGPLKDFPALREVNVPASALIGWDEADIENFSQMREILPPNLEDLRITATAPRFYSHLLKLAEVCAVAYPNLRKITICDKTTAEMEVKLAEAFLLKPGLNVDIIIEERVETGPFD